MISAEKQVCLVFRDKFLLPSEGFIPTHYAGFDTLKPVFVANQLGWRASEVDYRALTTSDSALGRLAFKLGLAGDLGRYGEIPPVVMHAHFGRGGALCLPLAKALGIPLFVTYHGGDATKETHSRKRIFPTLYQRRLKQLLAYTTTFLCVSDFVLQRLKMDGFPEEKLLTHYIGIDTKSMVAPVNRDRLAPYLFIGRMVDKKGLGDLIDAIGILQADSLDIKLDIAGSGPNENVLRKRASGLKNVRFLGWQSPNEINARLATCRGVIVPSKQATNGDCEGLPTVVLEALRAGAPVIATSHAGIPEVIRHLKTGFLAPESDAVQLAEVLREQSELDNDRVGNIVAAGQKYLRINFDATTQSKRLQKLFHSAASSLSSE